MQGRKSAGDESITRCRKEAITPEKADEVHDQQLSTWASDIWHQLLQLFQGNPDNLLSRIVTPHKSRVHNFDSEIKQQSTQWKDTRSSLPQKFKKKASPVKVMANVLWSSEGVKVTDYHPKSEAINGKYYAD